MRESGWNQYAMNPTSGAYGIPQSLPYTKMPRAAWPASAGGQSNPTAQINWMYQYITDVYGNPVNAWNHELVDGWYSRGGRVGVRKYSNGGSIPEPVIGLGASGWGYQFHAGEEVASVGSQSATADKIDELIAEIRALNATTAASAALIGREVGGALGGSASDASFRARYPRGGW